MTTEIHHLSRELLPVIVSKIVDGVTSTVTTGIECSFNPQSVTPTVWSTADVATDGTIGYLYQGDQPPGFYVLTVRTTVDDEEPVLASDLYRLT